MLYKKNIQDEIQKARKTGKVLGSEFQEIPNFKKGVRDGYDCPHCGAYHGYEKNLEGEIIYIRNKSTNKYATPKDIELMCNHEGTSWTEDLKCVACGKMYSVNNGCYTKTNDCYPEYKE